MFSLRSLLLTPVFCLPPLIAGEVVRADQPLFGSDSMAKLAGVFYVHVTFFSFYMLRWQGSIGTTNWLRAIVVGSLLGCVSAGMMATTVLGATLEYRAIDALLKSPNRAVIAVGIGLVVTVLGMIHGGAIGAVVVAYHGVRRSFNDDRVNFDQGTSLPLESEFERRDAT